MLGLIGRMGRGRVIDDRDVDGDVGSRRLSAVRVLGVMPAGGGGVVRVFSGGIARVQRAEWWICSGCDEFWRGDDLSKGMLVKVVGCWGCRNG